MRTIPAATLAELKTKLGTKPIIIIEVQWVPDGPLYTYSDIDINAQEGRILQMGGLDNTIKISDGGDSQDVTFTLQDHDNSIKTIIDSHNIHKRPVWVYQWFEGLSLSQKFLIFKGQVSTPIEWNEGDRTIRFTVINQLEDAEVGFSIEEGQFPGYPEELIGVPWPLVFGVYEDVPALRLRTPRRGVLKTGFGIRDFTLQPRIDQLKITCCPLVFSHFRIQHTTGFEIIPEYIPDPNCECAKKASILGMEQELALQKTFEYNVIEVIDGDQFPQGVHIVLGINGARLRGVMNGNFFTIHSRQHPELATTFVPKIKRIMDCPIAESGNTQAQDQAALPAPICDITTGQLDKTSANISAAWEYYKTFPDKDFFWAEAGSEVTLESDDVIIYVANILESDVFHIKAWRTFNSGVRLLTVVPPSYYTTRISDFVEYDVTEIVMTKPLSNRGEGWEDDVFVTLESTVGPNTVDILTWLIEKYTTFGMDMDSFEDVKDKIDNYPSSFIVPGRINILRLLEDISFQARCSLVLRNDVFHIFYLPEEPTPTESISISDIDNKTLSLTHTPRTEELVTKFVAEWKSKGSQEEPNKVILRHNVNLYGVQEQVYDFYIYNILELVRKSATFWLIRKANTWRKVAATVAIDKLNLEVFDSVNLNLSSLSDQTIKGIVELASYNSESMSIDVEIWTPVRSGERVPYQFAYPAFISEQLLYPTVDDFNQGRAGGTGPNLNVEAPQGHVLGFQQLTPSLSFKDCKGVSRFGGETSHATNAKECNNDKGDNRPSDIGDQKPEKKFAAGENVDVRKNPLGTKTGPEIQINQLATDQLAEKAKQAEKSANAEERASEPDDPGSPCDQFHDHLEDLPEECPPGCGSSVTVGFCKSVKSGSNAEHPFGTTEPGQVVTLSSFSCSESSPNDSIKICFDRAQEANELFDSLSHLNDQETATIGEPLFWPVTKSNGPDCPGATGEITGYDPGGTAEPGPGQDQWKDMLCEATGTEQ